MSNLQLAVQEAAASSSTGNDKEDMMDDERADFVETHCHWVNCDRDFDTQDQLVKVTSLPLVRVHSALFWAFQNC